MLFPGHLEGDWRIAPSEVVASWSAPAFAENLAVDTSGCVFVSLHSHNRIDRYNPRTRTVESFADLPTSPAGLAFDDQGHLWITGGSLGATPGFVWRANPRGVIEPWVEIPDAVFMNGCTPLGDGHTLLVCESATGRILAVDQATRTWRPWVTDPRLTPIDPQMPGANGIKIFGGFAYVSVTGANTLYRTLIDAHGEPSDLQVFAADLRADDFTLDSQGTLYIATHPAQSVLRLTQSGERTTIAGPDEGAVGSTACAFGRGPGEERALYVTTTGGVYFPYQGQLQDAKLLRLRV